MAHGFLYLVAILAVASRKVLSFKLSSTLTADFYVVALEQALQEFGPPQILNTDQGSQFTSQEWTRVLEEAGVRISMDGKGWVDNVFIERLWRTVKYDEVYQHAYADGREARQRLGQFFQSYNSRRLHQGLGYCTPDEVYFGALPLAAAA
jgi:putative transposase